MLNIGKFLLVAVLLQVPHSFANREIVGMLDNADSLKPEEILALRPLFNELQTQYDFIAQELSTEADINTDFSIDNVEMEAESPEQVLSKYLGHLVAENSPMKYDIQLPDVEELIGAPGYNLTETELDEFYDIESILNEVIDDAESKLQALTSRAIEMQLRLSKVTKPQVITIIYKAITKVYQYSVQLRRAAYCTYSYVPQLNTSMGYISEGVDCYTEARALIVRVEIETVNAVTSIRQSVLELVKIYKKIAAKKSLIGKIITILLNINKISNNINNTYDLAKTSLDLVQNELPGAVTESLGCALDFNDNLPYIISTLSELTTCITFVNDATTEYDFMRAEEVSNGNGI